MYHRSKNEVQRSEQMVKDEYEAVLKKVEKTTTDSFFVTERPRNARPSNKIEWKRPKDSVREALQ